MKKENEKKENEKKGLFERLAQNKKAKKNSSCCNFEVEEIPEKNNKGEKKSPKDKGSSCCK
ncbi:MAG: hypothetical protein LKE46_10080 [Clostridium sp.]|nr:MULTISPECIES: hypothetical protein [Clostridium]MCH3964611.1 hypothetical protein [Clostridium sp.]MCH4198572.1 hypothetical protein [Clostridium tyrobutyricum]MCH4258893.1 hypothetical protein [Clostridium tyrobutyricum]MCI1239759.1 hypothetical protein [Clostridium tyrobutyricum]MCI1651459.1 hypothetical protein [Clostridium tyrobutyricum]